MSWLSRNDWSAANCSPKWTDLNNLANDHRTKGGPVDYAGNPLNNLGMLTFAAGGYLDSSINTPRIAGNAGTNVISVENELLLTRAGVAGVTFKTAAAFAMGRYEVTTANPNTRIDLVLKSIASDDYVPDKTVMTWLSNGNVGIDTGAPVNRLSVNGGALQVSGSAADPGISAVTLSSEAAYCALQSWNALPLTINPLGNPVGIGCTPEGVLSVYGSGQSTTSFDTSSMGGSVLLHDTAGGVGNGLAIVFSAVNPLWKFAAIKGYITNGSDYSVGDITFLTRHVSTDATLSESMRITNGGAVGIGCAPGAMLDVGGVIRSTSSIATPTVGAGLEMFYDGVDGYIHPYDHNAPAWKRLRLNASTLYLNQAAGTGEVVIGSTTASDANIPNNTYAQYLDTTNSRIVFRANVGGVMKTAYLNLT